jgi:hypothetical protein
MRHILTFPRSTVPYGRYAVVTNVFLWVALGSIMWVVLALTVCISLCKMLKRCNDAVLSNPREGMTQMDERHSSDSGVYKNQEGLTGNCGGESMT